MSSAANMSPITVEQFMSFRAPSDSETSSSKERSSCRRPPNLCIKKSLIVSGGCSSESSKEVRLLLANGRTCKCPRITACFCQTYL